MFACVAVVCIVPLTRGDVHVPAVDVRKYLYTHEERGPRMEEEVKKIGNQVQDNRNCK